MIEIKYILRRLGVGPGYHGYHPVILSVNMVLEDENCLLCVSNRIYPTIVTQLGGTQATVERNLRTIAKQAWVQNRALLEKLAGYSLENPPAAKQFIEILYVYITRRE